MKKVLLSLFAVVTIVSTAFLFAKAKSSTKDLSLLERNVELLADTESPSEECLKYCEKWNGKQCNIVYSEEHTKWCINYRKKND